MWMSIWTNGKIKTGVLMADETSESKDEVISIDEVLASPPPPGPVEEAVGKAPVEETKQENEETVIGPDLNEIDGLLAAEDPEFARALEEIKEGMNEQVEGEIQIDTLDIEDLVKGRAGGGPFFDRVRQLPGHLLSGLRASWPLVKESLQRYLNSGKETFQKTREFFSGWIAQYSRLPRKSKLMLWAAIALGGLSVATLVVSFSGQLHIDVGPKFLYSFADIADAKFVYDENEPLEDFTDPLFHPEHIVAVDRIIVNLRRPKNEPDRNPMGFFDFYFEASTQECAVELKDREGEVRDLVARTLEQLTYEELVTIPGKEKMKLALRKSLNGFLTRGQIRRVFLKNIVLKE